VKVVDGIIWKCVEKGEYNIEIGGIVGGTIILMWSEQC